MGPDPWYFIWSLVCGMALGLLYDVLRIKRKLIKTPDIVVNIEDILFIIFSGSVAAGLAYAVNNGFFRIYSMISMVLGFVLYRLTVGRRVVNLFVHLYNGLCCVISKMVNVLLMPVRYVIKLTGGAVFITIRGFRSKINVIKSHKKREKKKINN